MAKSKKIIINNNNIDIQTTSYNNNFKYNINRKGRNKYTLEQYEKMDYEKFIKCLNQKIKTLKKYNDMLDYIRDNNTFDYFLTIRGINNIALKKLLDRFRKADKDFEYVSLAAWSINMDLHYHLLLKTNLSQDLIEKKVEEVDSKVETIYNSRKLYKYFKKNINYDTINVLMQFDNQDLKSKQIDILIYSKILNKSNGIKHKPIIIKNVTDEQIEEYIKNAEYLETIDYEYNNTNTHVRIDKYEK